jgi:high-affinity nickel-transport protein
MFASLRRVFSDETPGLRLKVIVLYAVLIAVNFLVWGATLYTWLHYADFLFVLAVPAYLLGLRHAVDADHIAAIDNVTRKLMQEDKKPVAVGFYFSLGHSTVVALISVLVGLGATYISAGINDTNSPLETAAGLIGTSVSAFFLLAMAVINIVILVQIVRAFHHVAHGGVYDAEKIDDYLNQRGFFARFFRGLFKTIDASWKMYPVGFLFGLGFDTATEIGLFVLAGTVGSLHLPLYAAFLLPLLFTAGMCLADTTDGVMMLGAYGWAFVKPIRKLFYNISITLVSVLVALVIGTIEMLSVIGDHFKLEGSIWNVVGAVGDNSGYVGAGIIAVFILSWLLSSLIYRINRYDEIEVPSPSTPRGVAS